MEEDKKKKKEEEKEKPLTLEQDAVVKSKKKRLVVSASAGSGKTFIVIEKLIGLICDANVPVSRLLVLTFTKAAANELKSRLYTQILKQKSSPFLIEQLDDIMVSDISTIDSFCEKVIKRNINKLSLPQNFAILDEKGAKKLKNSAFKRAFEKFSVEKSEEFEKLYFSFKRNNDALEECMMTMQAFFDSDKKGEELKKQFAEQLSSYHKKACKDLKGKIKTAFVKTEKCLTDALNLADIIGEKLAKQHIDFIDNLRGIIGEDFKKDFFDICKSVASKKLPAISTAKCDKEVKKLIASAKEYACEGYEIAQDMQFANDEMIESAKNGVLPAILLKFYDYYIEEYSALKEKRGTLDFADLERYARVLLEDDEVKKSLQERYDYIIIDEYQDTNRLQEAILKPIAEGGYFIAVGDIKQGIYGFRNASKEIMSEDIEAFTKDKENSEALYLRGNFRTDARILEFINKIFVILMTDKSVGINYKKTSMLEGKQDFKPNSLPPTRVDIVFNGKVKKEEKENNGEGEEKKKSPWEEVYSVKDDQMEAGYENYNEILTITARIEEALQEQIYSPKTKTFRQVEEGDIALLFRNRSSLMQELAEYLQARGYMVNADIKENLLEDSQIALINSLLKLSINQNDDIPLASVMASPFGGFTMEELGDIRAKTPHGTFYDAVKSFNSEKVERFFEELAEFKFNIQVFGIIKALEKLFIKTDYLEYLQTFEDGEVKRGHINKLFALIRSSDLDFSPQEVVSTLESSKKDDKVVADGGNAITLTTIHATKGLEYPVVIICGAGEKLGKAYNKNYIATKEFGLASHIYSLDNNFRMPSPTFLAGKMAKKRREFVDELMLFYVAVTRAQNHLYIIGSGKKEDYSFENLEKQNSYLKLIFFALGSNFVEQVFEQEFVETQNCTFSVITDFENMAEERSRQEKVIVEERSEISEEIAKLHDFSYPNKEFCSVSFKNSVTGINKLSVDEDYQTGEVLYKEECEERPTEENEEQKLARQKAVEIGNSYHEALKLINFSVVEQLCDLEKEFERIKPFMQEGYAQNIELQLLLKNILLIKQITGKNTLFKEKEFIMECSLEEIGVTQKNNEEKGVQTKSNIEDQTLIVQGIIDLFAMGEKLILVDYKYTSTRDEDKLIQRYKGQIDLYDNALEKAFGRKADEKYILSLKNSSLIKIG